MPSSDGFTAAERQQIDRAMRDAETVCRFEFSVFVGPTEGPSREYAERLHAALVAPDRSILLLIDPAARVLEIVTGSVARLELEDKEVRLTVVEMQSQLAHDDLVGAITRGIDRLAQQARKPRSLHTSHNQT
ncbi:TPM domain-containing protein [Nocardioides sp. HDW12B]|uniref:TPM domain-containing protein n=1 Tax=Nocardioides sp. HDW12B TaxID=2714939 RepID=UPI00140CECD7|nr:TPM domain-containing protein [Nocardioides sp. HDW12B]QIK65753.1 TPM domain-containing protein [Nocardioides sp. HDW12B]